MVAKHILSLVNSLHVEIFCTSVFIDVEIDVISLGVKVPSIA